MVLEGRLKMNKVLGSGNLQVFNDLKQHFGVDDSTSHISLLSEVKKVQKRDTKLIGNDEVFNAYEQCSVVSTNEVEIKQSKKDKDKKKKKIEKQERQKAIANVLEKFVKLTRVKEIRPLHLDTKESAALKEFYKKTKSKLNLRFYDNRPLKRLSSLFTR